MTLWGGRFTQSLDTLAWALNSSLPVDQHMAFQDVEGSIQRPCEVIEFLGKASAPEGHVNLS